MRKFTVFLVIFAWWATFNNVSAQIPTKGLNPKYIVDQHVDTDGRLITCVSVPGVPAPSVKMADAVPSPTAVMLNNVPDILWSFGCSATSAAMMAGYYDRTGYYNMYTGPTQGGLMPMDNSSWGDVTIAGEVRHQCPLSATRNGVDGRVVKGHVDDYWVSYESSSPDPYIGNWTQHAWAECTGDFMGTNQSTRGNTDGGTLFWYHNNGDPMCNYLAPTNQWDGCYGLARFFESRGYSVLSNCTQLIYSGSAPNGCTFANFKAEIDAGRPALIQLDGHTVIGYGYDNPNIMYIHDTWNYGVHSMTWGGSWGGLTQWGMTTEHLAPYTPDPCNYVVSLGGGGSANTRTYVGGGQGVWFTNSNTPCGYVAAAIEQVYSFVAPVSGYYSIQVTAADSWVEYMWRAGACTNSESGWNCISDVFGPGTYGSIYMSAGSTYSILLDGEDDIEDNHQFYIFYNPCLNVTSIAGTGSGNSKTYTGGGNGAWYTNSANPCTYICPGREQVYSFVAPTSGNYSIVTTAASGGYVDYLYKASSCGSTGWTCIQDLYTTQTSNSFFMTQGTTYYFLLDDENTSVTTQTFYISLTEAAGNWLGMVSNDWYDPANWSANFVPISTTDVTINYGYIYYPIIASGTAYCNNLTIGSYAMLKTGAGDLSVQGNMNIYGQFAMDNAAGSLTVNGNINWQSGSTANITAATVMWIYGDWYFMSGSNVQLANGNVDFAGSSTNYITNYAANSSFHNLGAYKAAGYTLGLSYYSTYDLIVNGYLYIHTNATFGGYSTHSLIVRGLFYNNNHFLFNYGTLVMDGVNQYIKPNIGDYVNNLVLSPTGTTTIDNTYTNIFTVKGNLTIESGVFDPLNNTVQVAGNWTNNVGPAGFTEGTGTVVFNGGNYHQYCSTETFNILEVNKPLGGAFRVNGGTVTCQGYDWTAGAVDVLTGTFTANDLIDNGLYGNYYLNTGGTINLHNTNGYVDLNGNLYIYGGNFNVWGGSGSDSWWPYVANGSVTMSGGVLDFKDVGIYVYNTGSYTFSQNITGGTIRTSGNFTVERADYTPTGGTVEFYGPNNGYFHTINGGYVRNVIINKGVADNSESAGNRVVRDRITGTVTDSPLSNTVTINNTADINGSVTIQQGLLAAGANSIYVEGNWDNQVGTAAFDEGTSKVIFDGAPYSQIVNGETFYDFWENKSNTDYNAVELMYGMTMNVINNLYMWDGSLELDGATTVNDGVDVEIGAGAGINANDYPAIAINLSGNYSNGNTDYDIYHGFDPGYYSTVTFNGTGDQAFWTNCPQEDFYNLTINKPSGKFIPQDNTQSYGNVLIQNGSWEDASSGLTHSVYNNFTVASTGAFLTTTNGNTVEFKGSSNSILTYSSGTGYFRNLLVNKSTGYNVNQATSISTQWSGNLTVGTGTYNTNGNLLFVAGDVAVNSTGILSLPAASTLVLTDTKTLNVNSGGRIDILGTSGSQVNIRANVASAKYAFNVNSGGTIAADYCTFKNMGVSGINVKTGSDIDLAHSFKGCTFQDGANNGTLLTIDNSEVRTIRNAVFPTNTWSGASNVTKTPNAGYVYFVDYSGAWSGEAYDNDFYNRVQWVPTLTAAATAIPGTICAGSSTQLNANPAGGVTAYSYAWSPAASLSNATIVNPVATPGLSTIYTVTVTDALGTTAISNVTVIVNPFLTPSVTISASANPSVPGDFVLFTATPVNGGTSPTYQWKVNGTNVGTLPTYSYVPASNDKVICVMTSNYPCLTGNPATSNQIMMSVVPINRTVTGTVNAPLSLCFDASNTITVAGGGNVFVVKSGASAVLIAGVRIAFMEGTKVELGGYMHGYITTTNAYCGYVPPSMPSVVAGQDNTQVEPVPAYQTFSIYPNPTTGKFTLSDKANAMPGNVQVEIFDLRGYRILSTSYSGERNHQITLPAFTPGLYFVKVVSGDLIESFKLIVTR